jgi:flavin-dependent dehydrogenase
LTAVGFDTDVLVAGAGPVGLAVAVLAARAGFSVTVVEPRADPVDKACGEGLMPGALAALARLGVDPVGRAFHGIRYLDATTGQFAEGHFSAGPGRGVRRTDLQAGLALAAETAGVQRVAGTVRDVRQPGGAVVAAGLRARWLVAADGLHSTVRRELGLDEPTAGRPRYGLRRHFRVDAWSDLVEVHWSRRAEAYVTPVSSSVVGVAVLTDVRGLPYGDWLAEFPLLAKRLSDAEPTSAVRGAGPLGQRASRRVAGRVLLVGDAAGYVDALTGEGVAVGLAQAAALVRCLVAGRPERYEAQWRTVSRRYRLLTAGVLFAAQHRALRRSLVPAAAALPPVFAAAVNALA